MEVDACNEKASLHSRVSVVSEEKIYLIVQYLERDSFSRVLGLPDNV